MKERSNIVIPGTVGITACAGMPRECSIYLAFKEPLTAPGTPDLK